MINGHGVVKQDGTITGFANVSGAGEVFGKALSTDGGVSAGGVISGNATLAGHDIVVENETVISTTRQLQNVISISGAGEIAGSALRINNLIVASQAGALSAATTVSAAGGIAGQNVQADGNIQAGTTLVSLGNITGSGQVQASSLSINNGASDAGGFEISQDGALSGAAGAQLGGTIRFDGAATAVPNFTVDAIYFRDGDDNARMKRVKFDDYATALAGAGLSATNGVLSTQGSAVNLITDGQLEGGVMLQEGYNILPSISAPQVLSLPSGTLGDKVVVKARDGVSVTNFITISSSEKNAIDGQTHSGAVKIESPFGAVSFVYCGSSDWRIL